MAKKKGKAKGLKSGASKPPTEAANGEVIEVASSPIPVSAKVCRLCETKEGPFLNIFDGEKNTAKKIEELMPFGVAENDELPHKICFRCSAKVEELHEFVQKCIKTQENLYNLLGKKYPTTKVKTHRLLWEEKLNRSNITNDDICDAVIKKAMEGIQSLPDATKAIQSKVIAENSIAKISSAPSSESSKKDIKDLVDEKETVTNKKSSAISENKNKTTNEDKCVDKSDNKQVTKTRSSRLNKDVPLVEGLKTYKKKTVQPSKSPENKVFEKPTKMKSSLDVTSEKEQSNKPIKCDDENVNLAEKKDNTIDNKTAEPFNIMNHISMIKVNGVGVLYQCKLCNRNFLKKDLVLSHWCAKNGAAKEDCIKRAVPPEPPKKSTVKYIYTKVDDTKKQHGLDVKNLQSQTNVESKQKELKAEDEIQDKKCNESKPKPKIGPASKVKRTSNDTATSSNAPKEPPVSQEKNASLVQMPAVPSLNCRYKLVPGPNNTFTLVEAHAMEQDEDKTDKEHMTKKRRLSEDVNSNTAGSSKKRKVLRSENAFLNKSDCASNRKPDIIELTDRNQGSVSKPYPVGLFQTVSRHSKTDEPAPSPAATVAPFIVSAQKKQSYTIVQTGNPSKLLISAKPQPQKEEPPKEKKKHKKVKSAELGNTSVQEPFSVTLEDTTHPKDSGFFTFINVDPLLQPSYVLPTDNSIIQESQISTSTIQSQKSKNPTKNEQYTCNMCSEVFTREQKLLVHIHSHYNKMDEEDQKRIEKPSRKRSSRTHSSHKTHKS